ncbi:MAG: hypothetical protein DMG57_29595 [Acidobacteria bacterium]|nr:MAG: hypothetical protein DMG57_29595 [Acidobacteriota bacterium]
MQIVRIATIFLSSLLLFLIQPIIVKTILPQFGGSAGVWTTCMLFFQLVLLLGYAYPHWTTQRLRPRTQIGVHSVLLAASLLVLPPSVPATGVDSGSARPVMAILVLLALSIGLPYFLLSTTGPLVQVFHARTSRSLPYWLFAVSNAASLAGLLAYPFLIEPWLGSRRQLAIWSVAYAAFVALMTWSQFGARGQPIPGPQQQPLSLKDRLLWIALAATPSALWLATAHQMSQSVAPVPLIWIVPLSIYLMTLVLCFHRDTWYRRGLFRWLFPVAVISLIAASQQYSWSRHVVWGLLLFSLALFVFSMFCHGELARRKPETAHLTSFYLLISLGGALGALFVGVVAPAVFNSYLELPFALVVCALLALALLYGYASRRNLIRLALVTVAAFAVSLSSKNPNQLRLRNFYGTLEVHQVGGGPAAYHALYNGSILHGSQFLSAQRSREPTTYYSRQSGVGLEIQNMGGAGRRIGVIGLGAGTIAAYARAGDYVRFYELNSMVIHLAREYFQFLRECKGNIEIIAGDARLALARETPQRFDLLAVDAFSGDTVPVHLLTKEAFELYFRHLAESGVLAVHVTSKYLDLAPVVENVAASLGHASRVVTNGPDSLNQVSSATWVIVKGMRPAVELKRVWTDDYTNLLTILK